MAMASQPVPAAINLPGLTTQEAATRLDQFGRNEPVPNNGWPPIRLLWHLLANPLVSILLAAAAISAYAGGKTDAKLIAVIIAVSVAINYVQTARSHAAAAKLRSRVAVTATVRRDGEWQQVARAVVVPGDVVQLSAGVMTPADSVLMKAKDLFVEEAALTGESVPVEKRAGTPGDTIYLGTSVVSGTGVALVQATGAETRFGAIAYKLQNSDTVTAFEADMQRFSLFILRAVLFLVLFVLAVNIALGRPAFQSLLFSIALAVGLTPEFLPVITSVTLANGAVRMARADVIVKRLAAIQNLGSIDVLCCDKTGTLTEGRLEMAAVVDSAGKPSERPLQLAAINSACQTGLKSPFDAAVLQRVAMCAGVTRIDEIPFDFERRMLSVVVERDGRRELIAKGAPGNVIERCTMVESAGAIQPLSAVDGMRLRGVYEGLEARGCRVLAVAWRCLTAQSGYASADEQALTLAGFIAFSDPVKTDTAASLADLRAIGIDVKLISGDSPLVAESVARQIQLDCAGALTGNDVEAMNDQQLATAVQRASVFARVSPLQKTRIVMALRAAGHTVGFLGDGINDAPSLRAADVGISVASAVDVAREAADVLLTRPGLDVIHNGVVAGRRACGNVNKYLFMGTSSNFGNMLSMAVASAFLPFLPMLPTQVLLNNLLYDVAQLAIPSDAVDDAYLARPHRWDFALIRRFMLRIGPVSSVYDLLTFIVLLKVFHAGEREFHTGWFVESLATQTLVFFVIRTPGNPFASRPGGWMALATCLVAVAAFAMPWLPFAAALGFTPLPALFVAYVVAATATYLVLVQWIKSLVMRGYAAAN